MLVVVGKEKRREEAAVLVEAVLVVRNEEP